MRDVVNEIVECHSGYAYAERPIAFRYEEGRLTVAHILAEWRSPGQRGFRVRAQAGGDFELIYDEQQDLWQVRPT